jgi:hypothetical protein
VEPVAKYRSIRLRIQAYVPVLGRTSADDGRRVGESRLTTRKKIMNMETRGKGQSRPRRRTALPSARPHILLGGAPASMMNARTLSQHLTRNEGARIPLVLRLRAAVKVLQAALTHPLTPARLIIDGERGTVDVVPEQVYEDQRSSQHA